MTDGKPVSREASETTESYKLFDRLPQRIILGWKAHFVLAVFLVCVLVAMSLGSFDVSLLSVFFGEASSVQEKVLVNIRMPRVVLAALVGASLALSGAALQGLFRNPLADPGLIGVSSGAALGAIFMIVLGGAVNMP